MKRILMTLAAFGMFAATSVAADLYAVKARIPFDFAVAGLQLPAGTYEVTRQGPTGLLVIKDAAGAVKAAFHANPLYTTKRTQRAVFVFNKYGDRYFLSRVWAGGMNGGRELRKTKTERELMAVAPHEQVIVASIYR